MNFDFKQNNEFVKGLISSSQAQLEAIQGMLISMENMCDEVKTIKVDIDNTKYEVKQLKDEIIDEIRLTQQQIDEIYNLVKNKVSGYLINKDVFDTEKFSVLYRKFIMKFWSIIKRRYGVSRYMEIKRKDFHNARDFIINYNLENINKKYNII